MMLVIHGNLKWRKNAVHYKQDCPLCSDGVEVETHFICICEHYKLQRDELITHPNFNNLTNIDKLAFLMKYDWKTLMQYIPIFNMEH